MLLLITRVPKKTTRSTVSFIAYAPWDPFLNPFNAPPSQFCFIIGINFYRNRCAKLRCVSANIVLVNCCISKTLSTVIVCTISIELPGRCVVIFKVKSGVRHKLRTDLYFIGYVVYLTLTKRFEPERVAISISMSTWILQATLSTVCMKYELYH